MRLTTGHPLRALRAAGLLLALWLAYRVPAMRSAFEAAITATSVRPAITQELALQFPLPPVLPEVVRAPVMQSAPSDPPRSFAPRTAAVRPLAIEALLVAPDQPSPIEMPTPDDDQPAVASVIALAASDQATSAYARLAIGDRRGAARLFDAALSGGDDPRAASWRRQRDALTRRWSASAYSIVRAGGAIDLAATPILGGGQSGAALAWAPDSLAARPLALTLRATAAHDDRGRSALVAAGIAWHPFVGVTVAAERLIALGPAARSDWTARIAGGIARGRGTFEASTYGEAGLVGSAVYAAAQAHIGAVLHRGSIAVGPGVGAWGSVQKGGGTTVARLDLGPGITVRAGPLSLAADYRFRIAGNAAPGSGPVVSLSAAF